MTVVDGHARAAPASAAAGARPGRARPGAAAGAVAGNVDRARGQRPAAPTPWVEIGGHQAPSVSLVSVMTALWFDGLTADDWVSASRTRARCSMR